MGRDKDTLCWSCAKACGDCDWSAELKPVKGWTAVPTTIIGNYGWDRVNTYRVDACPEYENDTDRYNQFLSRDISDNPIVKEVIRYRTPEEVLTTNKSDARKRLEQIPETEMRRLIENNLVGVDKDIAKLAFLGHLTMDDMSRCLYYCKDAIRLRMKRIIQVLTNAAF